MKLPLFGKILCVFYGPRHQNHDSYTALHGPARHRLNRPVGVARVNSVDACMQKKTPAVARV